jgi:hypothetical protein
MRLPQARRGLAGEEHLAARGGQERPDQREERRLAAAARSPQNDQLTFGHLERHAVDDGSTLGPVPDALHDVPHRDRGGRGALFGAVHCRDPRLCHDGPFYLACRGLSSSAGRMPWFFACFCAGIHDACIGLDPMSLRLSRALSGRITARAGLLAVLAVGAAVAVACTINPQPLPPESLGSGGTSSGGADNGSADSGTTGFGSDAAAPPATPDGGAQGNLDAGSDATAPKLDGSTDAGTDAAADAPNDAPEDG